MTVADLVLELNDLHGRTLEEILQEVATQQTVLMVRLPKGDTVTIQPAPRLKPLPVLQGICTQGLERRDLCLTPQMCSSSTPEYSSERYLPAIPDTLRHDR